MKDVVKGVRKGEKGFVIIAGDISPIDVITHLPVLCEDQQVPYVFIPSKEDLGTAASTKRPTSCIMVIAGKKNDKDFEDYKELYEECFKEAQQLVSYTTLVSIHYFGFVINQIFFFSFFYLL